MRWRGRRRGADESERGWPPATLAVAAGLLLATGTLVGLAWVAVGEMRRSATLLLEQRASEVAALTAVALDRDMKGAWLSVIVPASLAGVSEDPPYDVLDRTTRAFARFPYPDSVVVWASGPRGDARAYALTRADRPVPWASPDRDGQPYPVVVTRDPAGLSDLLARLRRDADPRRPFALLDTTIGGVPYQVAAHLLFEADPSPRLAGLVALTVNLDWVRTEYLRPLLQQVASIDGAQSGLAITVFDDHGAELATSAVARATAPVRRRAVPRVFFEPALLPVLPDAAAAPTTWTVQVQPVAGFGAETAEAGNRMLLLATVAGTASLAALFMTLRAVRVRAQLAAMKSEFVASVTHELKTPLALFKLVGETLEKGRYTSPDTIREYAAMITEQERRLSHLVDNLLTYARLGDLPPVAQAGAVDIGEVLEEALAAFQPRLRDQDFSVRLAVAPDLPQVRGDRVALMQAVANLIDNAVKYAREARRLDLSASVEAGAVCIRVSDHGRGIPEEEQARVFERFYRGREAGAFGSGLGLSIVRRTIERHGGTVSLESRPGQGTTVEARLPALARA